MIGDALRKQLLDAGFVVVQHRDATIVASPTEVRFPHATRNGLAQPEHVAAVIRAEEGRDAIADPMHVSEVLDELVAAGELPRGLVEKI